MNNIPSRRKALGQLAAMTAAPMLAASPFRHVYAQTAKQIRVGYLHIPSCDSQMWLMKEYGYWAKEGLEPVFTRFNTGIEGFSALVGGSVDVFSTGGVTHNFPARGQGVVVLPNTVEWGGQVFGRTDAGVNSLADLKGKKISTTLGTTGQIFLHTALKSVGLDSTKDVEIVSQTMPNAVTSFMTGSLPALSTWVPFNLRAREAKSAKLLAEARQFASKGAGYVITAYSTNKKILETNPDLIRRLIAADFVEAFKQCDVIMGPTSPSVAFAFGAKSADPVQMYLSDIYTIAVNLAGLPGMSIPCGFGAHGMPVGLQVIGPWFGEAKMLNVAHQYQQGTDWHARMPEGVK